LIEEGLYLFLNQNTAIAPLITTGNGVFLGVVPENAAFPNIMLRKVSGQHDTTFDGPSGFVIRRYQFTCTGKDAANIPGSGFVSAQKLADVLRQQLNGLVGTLPDGTLLFNAILDNEVDGYDSDNSVHRCVVDYLIHFQQP
jgi:hypothetical protein